MKTKLSIITGFLGSGKTSFLNQFLKEMEGKKIGLIVNEFGKLSIDSQRLAGEKFHLVELNGGSIFCSCLEISFISSLIDLLDKNLDHVLVESSGFSDPSSLGNILRAIEISKGKSYNYLGNICLIDCENFLGEEDQETLVSQVEAADLLVLSKEDLVDQKVLEEVREKLEKFNPKADIILKSQFNYKDFIKNINKDGIIEEGESKITPSNRPKSFLLTTEDSLDRKALEAFLMEISHLVYRVKGSISIEGQAHSVDLVGKRVSFKAIDPIDQGQLVLISRVGNQIIRPIFKLWEGHIGSKIRVR